MTVLFVSPHLDDVAFSCAGRLAFTARRTRAVVATLFSHGSARAEPTYASRRREDRDALASVGAEVVHLGLRDAPFRLGLGFRFEDLVLGPPIADEDVATAKRALGDLCERLAPDEVWLPLAVGGHVDHRVAFACRAVAEGRVRFYLDRPYAFSSALVALRRLELEGGKLDAPPAAGAIEAELDAVGVFASLFAKGDKERCMRRLAEQLAECHPDDSLRVEEAAASFPAEALELLEAYPSQLAWLGGRERLLRAYERWALDSDGHLREIEATLTSLR